MADAEKNLLFVFRANVTDFNKQLGDVERQFKRSFGNIQAELKTIAIQSTALAAAITVPMVTAFKSWAQQGEDIANLAEKTGLTTKEVQQFGYAASTTGSDVSGLNVSIKKMQQSLVDARTGGKAAQDAFKQLGLSWEALSKMSVGNQFKAIADALSKVGDEATRTDLAVTIFGRNGTEMLPMFTEGVTKLSDAFDKLGGGMSDADLEKAKAAQRAIEDLEAAWKQLLNTLTGAATGKEGADFITTLTEALVNMNKWAKENPEVVNAIGKIAIGVAALAGTTGAIASVGWALMPLIKAFEWLQKNVPGLGPMIGKIFGGAGLGTIGAFAAAVAGVAFASYEIAAHWDEIKQVIGLVVDIIRNNLGAAINGARMLFIQAKEGIVNAWNNVVEFFTGIVNGVKNVFASVVNFLVQPFRNAWAKIQEICNSIRNAWNNLFNGGTSGTSYSSEDISSLLKANYGYASGGIALTPQIASFAENGPEIALPLDKLGSLGLGSSININLSGIFMGDESAANQLGRQLISIIRRENNIRTVGRVA